MSDYTPSTNDVREDFAYPWEGFKQDREGRLAAFDRWIAAHDREVAAKALREAAEAVPVDLWATFGRAYRRVVESFKEWLHSKAVQRAARLTATTEEPTT